MAEPPRRKATYADVLAAPEHLTAEILAGELLLQPRPALSHSAAASRLNRRLGNPFEDGEGGPGGWILLFEPELHLGEDVLVPDLAGWRCSTMDHVANAPYTRVRPDWICEVLSPSTERIDRTLKLPIYAREGVGHAWLIDPLAHTLEALRLEQGRWVTLGNYRDEQDIRVEPFDAIVLPLGALWANVRP